jgi:hypothetical protein
MVEGIRGVIVDKVVPLESEWPNHNTQSIAKTSRAYDETQDDQGIHDTREPTFHKNKLHQKW